MVVLQDAKAKQELEAAMPGVIEEMKKTDPSLQDSIFWITGSTPVFNEIATINTMAGKIPVLSVVPDVVKEGDEIVVKVVVGDPGSGKVRLSRKEAWGHEGEVVN